LRECGGGSGSARADAGFHSDGALRAQIVTENFEAPNPDDSFSIAPRAGIGGRIVGGFGAIELQKVEGWVLERRAADKSVRPHLPSSYVAGGWGVDSDC